MMDFNYIICDVFTDQPFGGNPLAVVLGADALNDEQMQKIAREFNFSETTFVCSAQQGGDAKVRIFTPSSEVPFAGHPNIGTAIVLANQADITGHIRYEFEEKAGRVPVEVRRLSDQARYVAELTAPEPLSLGHRLPAEVVANVLGLPVAAINLRNHHPMEASVGLPFVVVELDNLEALQSIKINPMALEKLAALVDSPFIHAYVKTHSEFNVHARMFAPTDGVPEDPATGSANCALAALLATLNDEQNGEQVLRITQGVEMGRPSELITRVTKTNGELVQVCISGSAVLFSQGRLSV